MSLAGARESEGSKGEVGTAEREQKGKEAGCRFRDGRLGNEARSLKRRIKRKASTKGE